ncbi:MAG: DUF2088 domain-containing protein [Candidatus Lokiarchaeota archaeon]|nr:DUF2088 domain-containing protein [Candidatus Lokiarchaeota archaeon]MBD3201460.1 DUF2088 domain-containing protein [Candidatus Lokiarchaeota archaeon]
MKELIFYGDDVLIYDFPEDVDIYYAKKPIEPLSNDKTSITQAIENPIKSAPIESRVTKNSKIAICFDDVSVPLPLIKDDVRAKAAEIVIKKLKRIGIAKHNISFICATGLHRKCKPKELKLLLGKRIYSEFKNQIFNHDVSNKENLTILGKTQEGDEIEINKLASEADLIIYLNVTFTPLNGGWKSIIVGLGSYKSIIPHHSPEVLQQGSFMEPNTSGLHKIIWDMGRKIQKKINIFTIELVLNNNFFTGIYQKLYKPIGTNSGKLALWRKLLLSILRRFPKSIKSYTRKNLKAGYQLIGVFAGDIEHAHKKSLELINNQLNVPVKKQYDVIIYGAPNVTPYNVNSDMNPLLLHTLILGYLFNMHNGRSPLRDDGILIVSNPAYGKFDMEQHPSYYDFYNDILSKKPDIFNIKDIEDRYLNNEEYIKKYRKEYAYHGTHALMVYYWGILGLKKVSKVIIAGAKDKKILEPLNFDYAKSLDHALELCNEILGDNYSTAYLCMPPLFLTEFK